MAPRAATRASPRQALPAARFASSRQDPPRELPWLPSGGARPAGYGEDLLRSPATSLLPLVSLSPRPPLPLSADQPQPSSQERPWRRAVNARLRRRRPQQQLRCQPDLGEIQRRAVLPRCLANGCFPPSIRRSPARSRADAAATNTCASLERTRSPVLTRSWAAPSTAGMPRQASPASSRHQAGLKPTR